MFWKSCSSSVPAAVAIAVLLAGTPPVRADDAPVPGVPVPSVPAPAAPVPGGGGFTLDSVRGSVSLDDLEGKAVMLFFGYTSCPDVCPLSLAKIGACLSSLEAGQAQHVEALFITLDPGRDTAERMHRYAEFFHPDIIGLTGAKQEIDEVAARYGIAYERKPAPESALGYTISHPDTILLLDGDGALVDRIGGGEGRETLRGKVLALLARR